MTTEHESRDEHTPVQTDEPGDPAATQPQEDYAADAPAAVSADGGGDVDAPPGQPVDDLPYSEPDGADADAAPGHDDASPGDEQPEEAPVELSGTPTERLAQLGLELPATPAPLAAYVPAVRSGDLVYTSGQLPMVDGALPKTGVVGDEAVDVTPEEAAALARRCALNALAAVASVVDLDSVVRVVKVTGFVASAPGFTAQPVVVNGASELLGQVFGDAGRHARSAVGVSALPLGAPVEVEVVVQVG